MTAWLPVAFAAPCLQAAPQSDEPVVVGTEDKWEGIQFEGLHFALDLVGHVEENRIKSAGTTSRDSFNEIRGSVTGWTRGYIGHPNLIELNLLGTFGLAQQWIESDTTGRNEQPLNTFDEWDVSAVILQKSDLPTTIYSRATQEYLTQQFSDTLDTNVTETGIQTEIRSPVVPTTLHVFHRTEEQTSQLQQSDFNITQDTLEWLSQWRPADNQDVTWEYTLDNVAQSGDLRPTNTFVRQHAVGTHELRFGESDQNRLRSNFFGFDQTGDGALTRLRLEELLDLRHTPRFETIWDYLVDWTKVQDQEQLFQAAKGGFRHKLYESLDTNFNLGGTNLNVSDPNFTSSNVFSDLAFNYHKKVPLGRLEAAVGGAFDYRMDSERGEPFDIANQPHVVPSSGIVMLQQQNIVTSSIVVTDATGFITYVEGVDYTVTQFPGRVEITRITGGSIVDGQTILVDYQIGPEPASDTTTLAANASVRYDFDESFVRGLGVYMRYFHQNQDISTTDPGVLLPADVDDLVVGADYRIGNFFASAEQQWHDSSLSPYDATRLVATYKFPLGIGSFIDAYAGYDMLDRTDVGSTSNVLNVRGRWAQRIDRQLTFAINLLYRNEQDDPGGSVDAFQQGIDVVWSYRQTTISANLHTSFVNSDTSNTDYLTFQVGVRRQF